MRSTIIRKGTGMLTVAAFFLFAFAVLGASRAHAAESAPIKVAVDMSLVPFQVQPYTENGTTLVQIRPLFEAMGVALDWKPGGNEINGKKGDRAFTLTLGSKKAVVDGQPVSLNVEAKAIDGNTLVPLRFVGEATGALVVWDAVHREITVFTEEMLARLGITKEQAAEYIDKYLASLEQGSDGQDEEPTPAVKADLQKLSGMYYGYRADISGYECGGACWDYYTFLPNNRIVVGEPASGGPETIDCGKTACSSYTIRDGVLTVGGSEKHDVQVSPKGNLIIDDILLTKVKPISGSLKLDGEYVYRGYSGMVGVNSASSSWEEWITFNRDGTFQSENLTLGTLDTGSSETNSGAGDSKKGTYAISGNTIVLSFDDGTKARYLIFLHPDSSGKDNVEDIQIGDRNFYVDRD
ncbi:stalk domain-containing protein [Cohnella zeiphila]|uniref:Copper amine oxidase-like N-terminal domain-containing protein n=1 Tax=Cohnella zeiphila TaxID=2761120 RepID=A0A7X0SUU5_9BACL|nr:stalk domain-containing protein [Cohnella zeiphila]MBB6735330.1 hypothetical protein [Cohnella zeiphila]